MKKKWNRSNISRFYPKIISIILFFFIVAISYKIFTKINNQNSKVLPALTHNFQNQLNFSTSKITPNDGYTANIKFNNVNYSGYLKADVTKCDLNILNCVTSKGDWTSNSGPLEAINGVVTVPRNQNFSEGFYIARFRKPNSEEKDSSYTNMDVIMVTNRTEPQLSYSSDLVAKPVLGSYMIYKNFNERGSFIGYTRIDIETDPCSMGGITQRFTKTSADSYWNAGYPNQFRWCIKEITSGSSKVLKAEGGYKYVYDRMGAPGQDILTTYGLGESTPALLGGFGTLSGTDRYYNDIDQTMYYSLLPYGNKIPTGLRNDTPKVVIEQSYGHPVHYYTPGYEGFNVWHVEAFLPDTSTFSLFPANSKNGLRMRYIEYALYGRNKPGWSTQEDWTWNQNGIVSEIKSFSNPSKRCWAPNYACASYTSTPDRKLQLVDWYIPSQRPLKMYFQNVDSRNNPVGDEKNNIELKYGSSYTLKVYKQNEGANYTPYSGFIEMIAPNNSSGSLWLDIKGKPVYVHNGLVIMSPDAYGTVGKNSEWTGSFVSRPYLVNSSINSLSVSSNPGQNYYAQKYPGVYSNVVTIKIKP